MRRDRREDEGWGSGIEGGYEGEADPAYEEWGLRSRPVRRRGYQPVSITAARRRLGILAAMGLSLSATVYLMGDAASALVIFAATLTPLLIGMFRLR